MADDTDLFARQKRLLEELAVSPVVDVLGVVGPSGAGGGHSGDDWELWTLLLTFHAWQVRGGDLQTLPLSVSRMVTREELDRFRSMIVPYTVVHMKARVGECAFGGYQAHLETFVGVDTSDQELNHYAEELQKPVTFRDAAFGTFSLEREFDWFTAEVRWNGIAVSLRLSSSDEVQDALKSAHALWEGQIEWDRRIREYAAQELLPLKNGNWLDEDEAELTPDEFKDRMTLESITVSSDGSFDFWHDDGDLFWGHSIQISGSLSKGPTHADIPG